VFADVVNGADIRMIQSGSSASLAPEAFQGLLPERRLLRVPVLAEHKARRCSLRQKLQSHEPAQPRVLGLVDHPHPAATQLLQNAVV
jgi:hypothetical protein